MAIEIKFRRGTATQHNSFTGANGEITVDTTNKTIRVHDGSTVGGTRLAKFNEIGAASANLLSVTTNIVPQANITYDLGTPTKRWRSLYLAGNTIYLAGAQIKASGNGVITFVTSNNQPATIQASQLVVTANTPSTFEKLTITNLVLNNVLGVQYGGTGKSSLTQNGVMYASNSTAFAFATGSSGKVMQIGSNGIPKFDDVDGGSYS
jgi:hypothetical protein